jgi:hypothetical protein
MSRVRTGPRVAAAAVVAAVLLALAGVGVSLWAVASAGSSPADAAFSAAAVISFAVVGGVVAAARPGNRVGWLMVLGAVLWGLGNAGVDLAHLGLDASPGSVPIAAFFAVAGSAVRGAGWFMVTLGVPQVFPDGHLVGIRWRWLAWLSAAVVVATVIGPVVDQQANLTEVGSWHNPLSTAAWAPAVEAVAVVLTLPLGLAAAAGAVASLVVRWRRGGPLERQQITLLVAAASLSLVAAPIAFATGVGWVFSVAVLPLPFAIGFAVLARGLYDLRTAVNRSLVWITLSAVVAAAYALVIAGVGALLHVRGATGCSGRSTG